MLSTVWSSSLDRGLYQLLLALPRIRHFVPDFKVIVTYGTHNWEESLKQRPDPSGQILLDKIKELMKQPGVDYRGRVSKKDLACLQCQVKVWVYPTWFWETFSITAVENGLAGNALIYTDCGGLSDTVGGAGVKLPKEGVEANRDGEYPEKYMADLVQKTVEYCTNEPLRTIWADAAKGKMRVYYTWEKAADLWIKKFGWSA